jgi:predicted dehydrogenase
VFPEVDELLERSRPDVVVVATPPDSHAAICLKALESEAHVICEKPFVETVVQADAVLDAARRVGRSVIVNHEFRYMPIYSVIPPLVGQPDVGRPVFFHCTQFIDLAPWEEHVAWRAAMPDRALFEGGVHIVDLMVMMMDRMPTSVFAMTSSGLDRSRNADAIDLLTLDFGDGVLAQITIDRLCRSGTRYLDLRLDCEQASIRASAGGRAYVRLGLKRGERPGIRVDLGLGGLAWIEKGYRRKVIARNGRKADAVATVALYREIAEALEGGRWPPAEATVARDTLRIIEAAYRSARTGERVTLSVPS